tara:strand:- start:4025 stop:4657 length:633 start_codon:yes stop_codon:yes gene_type:complete
MKAKLKNNKIILYEYLPSEYSSENLNILGGFEKLDTSIHEQEGFFDYYIPFITKYQRLGEVYFDKINKIFTFPIIDFNQFEIDEEIIKAKQVLINKLEKDTDAFIKIVVGERSSEYEIAEKEAKEFKASDYLADIPLSISSDMLARNTTMQESCDLILLMSNNWRLLQQDLRAKRLLLKEKAKNCTTEDNLNIIRDEWNNFIDILKKQIK